MKSPAKHLGYEVGSDRKLAGWDELVEYFEYLARESPRVRTERLGTTTEGRPFILTIITSESNQEHLEELRTVQQRLADPRGLDPDDAQRLIERGRTIAMISCSIHATEVGAAQLAPELAYELAAGVRPGVENILDSVILLLVPSLNPDGLELVRKWYAELLGTPYEGARPVELYHKYVGHDNNRDWFMFTQDETRLAVEKVHNAWHPQIVYDMHQMSSSGYRFVLPPFIDPIDPNVDPALQAQLASIGTYMASRLTGEGKEGVATNVIFDAYSPSRAYQHYHGGVRILSEAASARLATPVSVGFEELHTRGEWDPRRQTWNHPLPWKGGTWSLSDIINYEKTAAYACLEHAACFRSSWLTSFYNIGVRAVAPHGSPFAYLVPPAQRDHGAVLDLIEVMLTAGIEVDRAKEAFVADGVEYPEGTYIIKVAQPYGAFARTMLDIQHYPDLRQYEGGPPRHPYDITGHTLWLQLGVTVVRAEHAFEADTRRLTEVPSRLGAISVGPGAESESTPGIYAMAPASNANVFAAFKLLESGDSVYRLAGPEAPAGIELEPGTFVVVPSGDPEKTEELIVNTGARAQKIPTGGLGGSGAEGWELRLPRTGLYKSWAPNADEGWTRFIFERNGVPYSSLHDADIRRGGLSRNFDAIILPSAKAKVISEGLSEDEFPPEYCGGLGTVGAARLQEFVRQGGTLIALDEASDWAIEQLWLPVKNAVANLPPESFYVPGSLLKTVVDTRHPLAYGMPRESTVLFVRSPVFEAEGASVVASYPLQDPLVSGFILGAGHLLGKGALVEVTLGKGRVVLVGFRTQFRAQARGTYKFLLNAVLHSTAHLVAL